MASVKASPCNLPLQPFLLSTSCHALFFSVKADSESRYVPRRFLKVLVPKNSCVPLFALLSVSVLWGCVSDGVQASKGGSSGVRRDPQEILSKTRKSTFDLLGTPDINRREGRTMQWQYRGDKCTLDVFFIAKGHEAIHSKARVQHFELRPFSSDARMNRGDLERCYARLVKTRRKSARSRGRG